jgi:hypothetical protein
MKNEHIYIHLYTGRSRQGERQNSRWQHCYYSTTCTWGANWILAFRFGGTFGYILLYTPNLLNVILGGIHVSCMRVRRVQILPNMSTLYFILVAKRGFI